MKEKTKKRDILLQAEKNERKGKQHHQGNTKKMREKNLVNAKKERKKERKRHICKKK